MEETRKRTREEEIKSGRREVDGEMERIAVDRKRACFEPCFMFSVDMFPRRRWEVSGDEREGD